VHFTNNIEETNILYFLLCKKNDCRGLASGFFGVAGGKRLRVLHSALVVDQDCSGISYMKLQKSCIMQVIFINVM
jgi:hypothetical protein